MRILTLTILLPLALTASPITHADLTVLFKESAPRDAFVITNAGNCTLEGVELEFDLKSSKGGLIFDTQQGGDGVEVFQPFASNGSKITLLSGNEVHDGDTALKIAIDRLAPNESARFTIDVDDTLNNSQLGQIRVTDSELDGALLVFSDSRTQPVKATFDATAAAKLKIGSC